MTALEQAADEIGRAFVDYQQRVEDRSQVAYDIGELTANWLLP